MFDMDTKVLDMIFLGFKDFLIGVATNDTSNRTRRIVDLLTQLDRATGLSFIIV